MNKGIPAIVWTLGLVFVTAAGAQFLAAGGDIFNSDLATWQIVVNAGIAAVVAFAINYMAPWIDRYGPGKT